MYSITRVFVLVVSLCIFSKMYVSCDNSDLIKAASLASSVKCAANCASIAMGIGIPGCALCLAELGYKAYKENSPRNYSSVGDFFGGNGNMGR